MGGKTTPKPSATPNQDAQDAALLASIAPFLQSLLSQNSGSKATKTDTSQTSTQTSVTKLTPASAQALLEAAIKEAGLPTKVTPAQVKEFMAAFKTAQDAQIEKIVQTARTRVTPGATAEAQKKIVEDVARQEFPSFFKPTEFAANFIWSKIDFKDQAQLGNKAIGTLESVNALVDSFHLLTITDNDKRAAAKQIAMGAMSLEEYQVQLQQAAKKEYPQFADRFNADPTLTTADIASPVINMLAKQWEVDPKTIKMDNPIVMSYMNYAGADGKGKQPSMYDLILKAKSDPRNELTQEANNNARDAAVGLSRAFGFGV